MKHRVAYVAIASLLLVLSHVAAASQRLTLSGAAFICANQSSTGTCPNAEFDPTLGSMNNAQGTWAANVVLGQGVIVTALRLCGQFNELGSSITATLDRTPLTASSGFPVASAMATVSSSGAANKTQCFTTTKISNATIDNTKYQYYVVVDVPDNNGVIFTSVQIDH